MFIYWGLLHFSGKGTKNLDHAADKDRPFWQLSSQKKPRTIYCGPSPVDDLVFHLFVTIKI
jgi:hypothetical protein